MIGASMNGPMSANSMMLGVSVRIAGPSMPMNAPASRMFSRPVRSWSKPAPSVSRLEIRPSTSTEPADGVMIPASTWSSVLLPAPFGPMTAERLAVDEPEVHVAERPEVVGRSRLSRFVNEWRSVVLPGELQAVLDAQPVDVDGHGRTEPDGVGHRGAEPVLRLDHHRTLAKDGSRRLNSSVAIARKTIDAEQTRGSASQSGGTP